MKFRRLQWIWAVCGRGAPSPPSPPASPPPCGCCHTIYLSIYLSIYLYIYIYIVLQKKSLSMHKPYQALSLFTPQTLHPDILRKQKQQTWHHVFLPTYGRAEADDAQRLKLPSPSARNLPIPCTLDSQPSALKECSWVHANLPLQNFPTLETEPRIAAADSSATCS